MVFNVDGGCRRNGEPDAIGVAACCLQLRGNRHYRLKTRKLDDYPVPPTSQRAEITAIILALEWALERFDELQDSPMLVVDINSDSRYAVDCMTDWIYKWTRNGWTNSRGVEVANRDLLEVASELDDRVAELGSLNYNWVPREDNVDADSECQKALIEQDSGSSYY